MPTQEVAARRSFQAKCRCATHANGPVFFFAPKYTETKQDSTHTLGRH